MRARQSLGGLAAALLWGALLSGACATTGALTPGERLARAKCGACHVRPAPSRLPPDAWPGLLVDHRERVPLDPDERHALLRYLQRREEPQIPTP